ncbi:leucine-rich repeat and immunoglobulin-like domain-containing nogo receptor-interacting protein 1 [Procambarus clarkii]|uniref:leucine-rich repeat and immunoglobulin-like domain-containing nogo receptor-interacting protein 1 n=1 Tax=Procambarus clarkii TaxID=6728 RepID=UPI001E6762B6|nr:leucine-rich repeat and immunoglobulin-like domain-containing nogo receptor-interacting protein 1 [Procambarus clarkii]
MVWCVVSVVVVVAATLVVQEAVAVATCPEECLCLSDSKVICNGGKLTSVPEKLQDTVEDLSLSKNLLPGLTTDMFRRWRHLKVLHLNDNQIMDIKPFAFRGLAHLKEISIQNNPLAELPRFSFAGLENVNQINLCKNRITTIHPYVFAGSRNIGMILLQENPLTRVMARAFSGLRTAQFLYLPSWVKVIESDAFYDLEGVGLLRLHSLDLHALRPHTFRGLRNVTQISIQESDLGTFRDLAFDGLQNVGELRILNNKVDILESLEVREESNVDTVIVQGNHFLQVSQEKPLRIHANVRSVVTGNYLPCSCQLWWVLESPLAVNTPLFSRHNFCVSPYNLHGKDIMYVDMDKLERCPAPQELQQPSGQETSQGPPTPPLPDVLSALCVSLLLLFRPDW